MEEAVDATERLSLILHARLKARQNYLTESKVRELKKLIESVLADVRAGHRKLDDLDAESEHFKKLLERDDIERSTEVVVPLARYRTAKFPLQWGADPEAQKVVLLTGDKESNWRRAVDLHHESGRYAFLNYADISSDVWANPSAVKDLGAITVFIPEIAELTLDQMKQLDDVLSAIDHDEDAPRFFVATSQKSFDSQTMSFLSR